MNKKIISSIIAALMVAGSTSFSVFAKMADGTVVIGNKAFDLNYANAIENLNEITDLVVKGGSIYVKDFKGNWIDNVTSEIVQASIIPAVVYKNVAGVETSFDVADTDKVTLTPTPTPTPTPIPGDNDDNGGSGGNDPIAEKATVIQVNVTTGSSLGMVNVSALPGNIGSTMNYTTSSAIVLAPLEGQAAPEGLLDFASGVDMRIAIGDYIHIYEIKNGVVTGYGESKIVAVAVVAPVNLGTAGNFAILAKTGISSVPNSVITGDIGVSPIGSTSITGFSLKADATNVFSTSTQVTGKVYAPGYTLPTPSNLTTAVSDMETALVDAAGRAADYTELHNGDISSKTLTAGVYKWGTNVLINSDVTLTGGPNDVFIFQIAKGITQASGTKIILAGGVQAKNIFWQTEETVSIGTNAHFEGIVLSKTNIALGTNASLNGRLLAQTAVTLDQSTVVAP